MTEKDFKNAYRRSFENIGASEDFKRHTLEKMQAVQAEEEQKTVEIPLRVRNSTVSKIRYSRIAIGITSAAACAVLAVAVVRNSSDRLASTTVSETSETNYITVYEPVDGTADEYLTPNASDSSALTVTTAGEPEKAEEAPEPETDEEMPGQEEAEETDTQTTPVTTAPETAVQTTRPARTTAKTEVSTAPVTEETAPPKTSAETTAVQRRKKTSAEENVMQPLEVPHMTEQTVTSAPAAHEGIPEVQTAAEDDENTPTFEEILFDGTDGGTVISTFDSPENEEAAEAADITGGTGSTGGTGGTVSTSGTVGTGGITSDSDTYGGYPGVSVPIVTGITGMPDTYTSFIVSDAEENSPEDLKNRVSGGNAVIYRKGDINDQTTLRRNDSKRMIDALTAHTGDHSISRTAPDGYDYIIDVQSDRDFLRFYVYSDSVTVRTADENGIIYISYRNNTAKPLTDDLLG